MFPTDEHIQAAQEAADYWAKQTGVYVWPSVSLAQAKLESAGWTKLAGKNNGFGIKATKAQIEAGQATYVWTTEVVNGRTIKVKQWFADYASLKDAYIAHGRLLATVKVYAAAWKATRPEEFIRAIAPHYATAPNYAAVILKIMDDANLYRYDGKHAVLTQPAPKSPAPTSAASGAAGAGAVIVAAGVAQHASAAAPAIAAFVIVAAVVGLLWWRAREKPPAPVTVENTAAPPEAAP